MQASRRRTGSAGSTGPARIDALAPALLLNERAIAAAVAVAELRRDNRSLANG